VITLALYPPFNHTVGKKELDLPFTSGMTIRDLLSILVSEYSDLREQLRAEREGSNYLVIVDRRIVGSSYELRDEDQVLLVAPVAGG
jgi:molybdopterin converting factor small subunit